MIAPEFSRVYDRRKLPTKPVDLEANTEERAALAERFGLVRIERLTAHVSLTANGEAVAADGTLAAAIVQTCAVSGDELPAEITEPLSFRFVPDGPVTEEEIELDEEDLDEIPYDGTSFDLGEAVAQSLALAIDPYAEGPEAERIRKEAGLDEPEASGPLAEALRALKKD